MNFFKFTLSRHIHQVTLSQQVGLRVTDSTVYLNMSVYILLRRVAIGSSFYLESGAKLGLYDTREAVDITGNVAIARIQISRHHPGFHCKDSRPNFF